MEHSMRRTPAALVLFLTLGVAALAQTAAPPLDTRTVAENRELDRLLIEAHAQRSVAKVMELFVKSPDTFFIAPNGVLAMGWDGIRDSYARFFAGLDSISAEIKDVKYIRAGDGIIAVGTVVFHRKDKNAPVRDLTVVWTDFRRKEDGKWKYVFRHAHWPLPTQPEPKSP
jgi:ketosteroid isomerase-like protein